MGELFRESCDPCHVCYSRFETAFLALAIPHSLAFKPGHLSVASSTSVLAVLLLECCLWQEASSQLLDSGFGSPGALLS